MTLIVYIPQHILDNSSSSVFEVSSLLSPGSFTCCPPTWALVQHLFFFIFPFSVPGERSFRDPAHSLPCTLPPPPSFRCLGGSSGSVAVPTPDASVALLQFLSCDFAVQISRCCWPSHIGISLEDEGFDGELFGRDWRDILLTSASSPVDRNRANRESWNIKVSELLLFPVPIFTAASGISNPEKKSFITGR